MSTTDFLRLSEHKLFRELKDSLSKTTSKTQNLLAVHDGILFTWDFQDNCILSLNIKAARSREGDQVIHQKLLPLNPPLFSPDLICVNEVGTLLLIAGTSGVLVLQLPQRYPPFGAFDNNKELVYCRSYSLDERLLCYSDAIEVRKVRFHPGSADYNHIVVLSSDNMLRLYKIHNNEAVNISVHPVGERPGVMFPGSNTPFLDIFGEIAVDFDFGHPDISTSTSVDSDTQDLAKRTNMMIINKKHTVKIVPKTAKDNKHKTVDTLLWPIYILRADLSVYSITIDLDSKRKSVLKGPLPLLSFENDQSDACSIMCLNTMPQIICIALSSGTICHSLILDIDEETFSEMKEDAKTILELPTKEILAFETVELEMGLKTLEEDLDSKYKCPIFLHKDESNPGRYYATHSAGIHSVTISCTEHLQRFVHQPTEEEMTADIFVDLSKTEYLVCTKTASSDDVNYILGFSVFYEPSSIITLLADGTVISLSVLYTRKVDRLESSGNEATMPYKKMLSEPFDQYIQNILSKASTQLILKLPLKADHSQEQLYKLLQRVAKTFRDDYFKHHMKAREELDKRIQMLTLMKKNQLKEIERMNSDKEILQETASNLAEKYEDIKDRQDDLLKRCENLLMLVARKKSEPSDAELAFIKELQANNEKLMTYQGRIDKIKGKAKYQEIQMENWKAQEIKKCSTINEDHVKTIKSNLTETTKKISKMIEEINELKHFLNLK